MIGIDEVGRGAWAGPLLVVAARQVSVLPAGLKDSKILTKKRREAFRYDIELCCDIGEGWVTSSEVDEFGLTKAMYVAVERALSTIAAKSDEEIIMDGHINYCGAQFVNARPEIAADANFPIVSAASIYAKVVRDDYMTMIAKEYPEYGFDKHVGYGTKQHLEVLAMNGVTDVHRKSYAPIRKLIK